MSLNADQKKLIAVRKKKEEIEEQIKKLTMEQGSKMLAVAEKVGLVELGYNDQDLEKAFKMLVDEKKRSAAPGVQ